MTESYYVQGQDRSRKVRQLFDAIANRYDLINDLQSFGLHRFWKNELIRMSKIRAGENALDLCTGTGDIAIKIAARGAEVTGCDFSEPMLAKARLRCSNINWIAGDALNLSLPDNSFDVVSSGYGLRNLADFRKGLDEMLRVLKPKGRLLILEFGKPRNLVWRKMYFAYLRFFVPVLGAIFCGDPSAYRYILESLNQYPGQDAIHDLLLNLNCRNVSVKNFLGGVMSINYAEKP
jgi:demethylmenaquinone methyltransferase/2-methoxy-6-polyprenyl-1,4-benzoquinol methylase